MIPALSRIWEDCFGDSPEYIRFFMENRFPSCQCFAWLDGEEPTGAAYLLPCTLGGRPAYYGYAVGVSPAFRHRGICTEILRAAEELCTQENAVFFVMPRPGVESYYLQRGFLPAFFHRVHRFVPTGTPVPGVEFSRADAETYLLRRDSFFEGPGYVAWDMAAVSYALEEQRLCGGFAHMLCWQGNQYLLFGTKRGGTLFIRETTIPLVTLEQLVPSLCAHYGVSALEAEYPADSIEEGVPRGCCWNVALGVPGWLGFDLA